MLVVGGGESAIEAAVGLARQAGNDVTLSYRKNAFHRVKQKNQAAIESLRAKGRVRVLFDSQVVEIEEDRVRLRIGDRSETLANDFVFVFIGGDPPYRFLEGLGVRFGGPPRPGIAGVAAALALVGVLLAPPLAAQESPHGEMPISCEDCHTTADWKVVREDVTFDHATTGFPLAGVHARLNCSQCHTDKVFRRVGTAAPGADEDRRGEPFVGRAGELLTRIIEAMDRERLIPGVPLTATRSTSATCSSAGRRRTGIRCRTRSRPARRTCTGSSPCCGRASSAASASSPPSCWWGPRGRWAPCADRSTASAQPRSWSPITPPQCLRNPGLKRPVWEDMQRLAQEYLAP